MRSQRALLAGVFALATWTAQAGARPAYTLLDQHEEGEHHHDEAAALKNPTKATADSVAAGKKLYDAQCVSCHGVSGKGDGKMAASINPPKPSDLTDAAWKHGSTDGEIYTLIHDGSKGTGMRGYASRMKTQDIWNVVNYLRSLGPPPKSR